MLTIAFVALLCSKHQINQEIVWSAQRKLCRRPLNQATLETQDKSSDLAIIRGDKSDNPGECDIHELGPVMAPPGGPF
ncbi:hypothetical protein O181_091444 [Austropuccinia psidii MF-1]|uniref:Uncharacterized protein n=1 Tax=Austropuccinia psidii MF-1 TaxID=1389203 RepID=A0A9Q3IXD3_9BASI|nr:hypothetical protein [Austropuccinia psidii MF-1]